jgi:hypothetical protein
MTGPFTFTSPMVYVAHKAITVLTPRGYLFMIQQPQNGTVHTHPPGIMSLRPEEVFSVRMKHQDDTKGVQYAQLVANGSYQHLFRAEKAPDIEVVRPWLYEMLPFDFGNLQNPVPANVYYDARAEDCWGNQTHCATITDNSYRPQLAFKKKFWESLVPDYWASGCYRPKVVDPPIALLPITTPASPVRPKWYPKHTAQPGSVVLSPWPIPTLGMANKGSSIPNGDGRNIPLREESGLAMIGSHTLTAQFVDGLPVTAYIGTSTLAQGQSITLDGKIVSMGPTSVFVDGIAASFTMLVRGGSRTANRSPDETGALSASYSRAMRTKGSWRAEITGRPLHEGSEEPSIYSSAQNQQVGSWAPTEDSSSPDFFDSGVNISNKALPNETRTKADGRKKSDASQNNKHRLLIIFVIALVESIVLCR